ncbi:MAG: DUF6963 family protein [Bacillota bacterium]
MTIGIVSYGRKAGLGIFKGLEAAEKVSEGSIFGFAVLRVITDRGEIVTYDTQRGGTTTLITCGETTGCLPPIEAQEARFAAIISSGPDRGEFLAKKIPGDPLVGLVSGHRHSGSKLPGSERTVVETVFDYMKTGMTAPESTESVIKKYPYFDAGIVALDIKGNIGCENSEIVNNRSDVMKVVREDPDAGYKVAVLTNEIYPKEVAILVAAKCMQIMTGARESDLEITIKAGLKIELASEDVVVIEDNLIVKSIMTKDFTIFKGERGSTIPTLNTKVKRGSEVIGYTISEPVVSIREGVILNSLGDLEFKVPVKLYKIS